MTEVADNFKTPRWFARPALKQRLIVIRGNQRGFQDDALSTLAAMEGGKRVLKNFLNKILNAHQSTPLWIVIGLTRIAEDDLTMPRDIAMSLATRWFTIKEV